MTDPSKRIVLFAESQPGLYPGLRLPGSWDDPAAAYQAALRHAVGHPGTPVRVFDGAGHGRMLTEVTVAVIRRDAPPG